MIRRRRIKDLRSISWREISHGCVFFKRYVIYLLINVYFIILLSETSLNHNDLDNCMLISVLNSIIVYSHFWRTQNPLWEKQTSQAATLDGHLKSKRHIWGAMAAHEKSGGGTHFEASLARTREAVTCSHHP